MTPLTLYHKNKIEYVNVPCDFIDNYLMEAPGEFVKIYLYLLRCIEAEDNSPTLSDVADKMNFTESDVLRALKYWEKKNLLSLIYNSDRQLCGVDFHTLEPVTAARTTTKKAAPSSANAVKQEASHDTAGANRPLSEDALEDASAASIKEMPAKSALAEDAPLPGTAFAFVPKKNYTKTKVALLSKNPEVRQMLFIAEQYLGTSFNPSEMETLLYIYDRLGFSVDLIEYLLGVCVEKKITSLSHIEDIAVKWFENGIQTVSDAKKSNASNRKVSQAICKALGIEGRTLAESEQLFLMKWTGTYHFSLDFILEACHRTIQTTGKPSFTYIDTILKNWREANVTTMTDVQALDEAHQAARNASNSKAGTRSAGTIKPRSSVTKSKGNNFPERSYDYSALEQQLLNT